MKDLPTREQCLSILKEAGCESGVIEHCLAVEKLALQIGQRCREDIDLALLSAGALLHDAGRGERHDIQHAIKGVAILQGLGIDQRVIDIVKKHIGAGLTRDDARSLGLPEDDYMPSTLGDPSSPDRRKTKKEVIQEFLDKGLLEAAKRARALHDELSEVCGIDLDNI